jgi:hypothetical protein
MPLGGVLLQVAVSLKHRTKFGCNSGVNVTVNRCSDEQTPEDHLGQSVLRVVNPDVSFIFPAYSDEGAYHEQQEGACCKPDVQSSESFHQSCEESNGHFSLRLELKRVLNGLENSVDVSWHDDIHDQQQDEQLDAQVQRPHFLQDANKEELTSGSNRHVDGEHSLGTISNCFGECLLESTRELLG